MTEDQIEDLRAERDYWRQEALGVRSAAGEQRLAERFGLTAAEAWLFNTMHELGADRVLLFGRAEDEMPGHGETRVGNTVHVMASRLRKKVGADAFVTVRKRGYSITNRGLDLCRIAMSGSTSG